MAASSGVATLVIFPIPTAWRAWIEDVIVDEARNGRGIGAALTQAMVEHSRAAGCKTVDLTSRPKREAANHMYRKLGFVQPRHQRLPLRPAGVAILSKSHSNRDRSVSV